MNTWVPFLEKYEKSLLNKYGKPKKPIIAVSGLSGVGKNTHSKLLQQRLQKELKINMKMHNSSDFFRKAAKQYGYSEARLVEFNKRIMEDRKLAEKIDHYIETKTLETVIKNGGIFVGRITFAVAGNWGFKIFLKVDSKIAAERIHKDETRAEHGLDLQIITSDLVKRDEVDIERYKMIYGIDYNKLSKRCDAVIVNHDGIEETSEKIFNLTKKWLKKNGYLK